MLSRYQKGRRELLAERGVDVDEFADDQLTSADDVFFFPNMVGPIYPGTAIIFRVRPNGLDPDSCHQRHVVPRMAACRRRPSNAVAATLLPRLDRATTGASSRTRTTPTWSTCRSA